MQLVIAPEMLMAFIMLSGGNEETYMSHSSPDLGMKWLSPYRFCKRTKNRKQVKNIRLNSSDYNLNFKLGLMVYSRLFLLFSSSQEAWEIYRTLGHLWWFMENVKPKLWIWDCLAHFGVHVDWNTDSGVWKQMVSQLRGKFEFRHLFLY